MMCDAAKLPNIFPKITFMAGGPSQLEAIALATFVRHWVARHLTL